MQFNPNKTSFISSFFVPIEEAKFIILPIPYECTTSYGKGTRLGPLKILDASYQLELWDEEICKEIYKVGIYTLDYFKYSKTEKSFFENISKYVSLLINKYSGLPIFIGGEHSITQGLIPPLKDKYKNLSILHFDAHADLRDSYEGTLHSHASALYPAAKDGINIVQIGIRSVASEEKHLINKNNVKTFLMHENLDIKKLKKDILKNLSSDVYLTIDVDGFDPSVMPATGTPQPGGFMWYDALEIFRDVIYKRNVVGFDVVEVSPNNCSNITEFNAAKLIYRLMGYIADKKKYI